MEIVLVMNLHNSALDSSEIIGNLLDPIHLEIVKNDEDFS